MSTIGTKKYDMKSSATGGLAHTITTFLFITGYSYEQEIISCPVDYP